MATSVDQPTTSGQPSNVDKPTVILVIGMAGSGKTTFIQRLNSHLHTKSLPGYIVNLDPAVTYMPYGPNIDIRDTVKYKNVMKQYNLGPNGGILTSCNLFATRFDQVIQLCEKPRDPPLKYIIVDTPGQIEIFTWSASGAIITELFASTFPTIVVYVVDTPRCTAPQTFMSNMLQACSILYKTQLPLLLAFNKTDIARHEFAQQWMSDFESYHAALESDPSYSSTLSRTLSLVLEEFYSNLTAVGVSALTGAGMDDFLAAVEVCRGEYRETYLPLLEQRKQARQAQEEARQQKEMGKLKKDMQAASISKGAAPGGRSAGVSQAAGSSGGPVSSMAAFGSVSSVHEAEMAGVKGDKGKVDDGGDDSGESCDYTVSDDDVEDEDESGR